MDNKDFVDQDSKIKYIYEHISDISRLSQLGEECSELSQSIFKYLRKLSADNPTPKTEMEIIENVKKEIMDVQLSMDCVNSEMIDYEIYNSKLNRWVDRVNRKEVNKSMIGKIKTVGDLRKLIEDLDDEYQIDLRIVEKVPKEELAQRSYPYPYDLYCGHLEFHDVGYGDKELCLGAYVD